MKILLAEKVTQYINNLSPDRNAIFLNQLLLLKNKSKSNIKNMEEVIELSENQSIKFYGYYIENPIYAIFAFNNNDLIVVDLIELKDNKINSLTLTPEETLDNTL